MTTEIAALCVALAAWAALIYALAAFMDWRDKVERQLRIQGDRIQELVIEIGKDRRPFELL